MNASGYFELSFQVLIRLRRNEIDFCHTTHLVSGEVITVNRLGNLGGDEL